MNNFKNIFKKWNCFIREDTSDEYDKIFSDAEKIAASLDSFKGKTPEDSKEDSRSFEAVPEWLRTGAALKLLSILQHFGTEDEILSSMDKMIRIVSQIDLRSQENISKQEIISMQKKLGVKTDADVGPETFAAICIVLSPSYSPNRDPDLPSPIQLAKESFDLENAFKKSKSDLPDPVPTIGVIEVDTYIDKMASSKSLLDASRSLKKVGHNIIVPPRANLKGKGRAARSLDNWREDKQFLSETEKLAKKYGMTRAQLLAIFWHESSGTMSPRIENNKGFTGLIQFETMEGSRKAREKREAEGRPIMNPKATIVSVSKKLGRGKTITKKELKAMTRVEQLKLVEAYFDMRFKGKPPKDKFMLGRIYCAVLYPIGIFLDPDEPVMASGKNYFKQDHPYRRTKNPKRTIQHAINSFESNGKSDYYRDKGTMTIRDFQAAMERHIEKQNLDF